MCLARQRSRKARLGRAGAGWERKSEEGGGHARRGPEALVRSSAFIPSDICSHGMA